MDSPRLPDRDGERPAAYIHHRGVASVPSPGEPGGDESEALLVCAACAEAPDTEWSTEFPLSKVELVRDLVESVPEASICAAECGRFWSLADGTWGLISSLGLSPGVDWDAPATPSPVGAIDGLREFARAAAAPFEDGPIAPAAHAELAALRDHVAELSAMVYAPGEFVCRACSFRRHARTLDASTGDVGINPNTELEACPNGCGDLERVTWREYAEAAGAIAAQFVAENSELRAAAGALVAAMDRSVRNCAELPPRVDCDAIAFEVVALRELLARPRP